MADIDFNELSSGSIVGEQWEGTGVLDKLLGVINKNVQLQLDTGRITNAEYGELYLGSMQLAVTESMKFILNKQTIEKQLETQDIKIALDEVQLAENSEKWLLQRTILENQVSTSNIDLGFKEQSIIKDLELKDRQVDTANADIAFNESKKEIMEQTRKDNIRAKASEQFAEFMKYISAANVVPGPVDFQNMRNLITAMNAGIADPDAYGIIETTTTDYVKPPA